MITGLTHVKINVNMGNSCCGNRIKVKSGNSSQSQTLNTEIKKTEIRQLEAHDYLLPNNLYGNSQTSIRIEFEESLVEELEYELCESDSLNAEDQNKIVQVLDSFKTEIPTGEQEFFEGFTKVKVKISEEVINERIFFVSNFAIYLLKSTDLSFVYRRIHLENIQVVLLDNSLKSIIFHMVNNEILGDLWITSKDIEDIHNCIQTMFRFLTHRYIPVHTYPTSLLPSKYNNLPMTFIQSLMEESNLRATNIIIQEGKIGEIIIFNLKTKSSIKGDFLDCIIVLTNLALYSLNLDYGFISRLDLKLINQIQVNEKIDKILIQKNSNEEYLYTLGSKFLTLLEKSIMEITNQRVPIIRKISINVDEFLNKTKSRRLART